jgi:hypothetical protein
VLITMQSTSSLWAAARISAYGSPEGIRIRDFTEIAPSRVAILSRYAFDRVTLSENALDSSACPASGAFPRGDGTTFRRRTSAPEPFAISSAGAIARSDIADPSNGSRIFLNISDLLSVGAFLWVNGPP